MRRLRVLHLIKTTTGADWAFRQVRELIRAGFDVHVALPADGSAANRYESVGATVHRADVCLSRQTLYKLHRLSSDYNRLITLVRPHIVHSHFAGTTAVMRLRRNDQTKIRIFQVPGPLHLESEILRRLDVLSATRSDFWIASCKYTARLYTTAGVSPTRVFLSYYGTDTGAFSTNGTGTLQRIARVAPGRVIVGMVAFMYPPRMYQRLTDGVKGHRTFIDAMRIVLDRNTAAHAVLIGGAWGGATWFEEDINKYASERLGDRVSILGGRNDVPVLYPDIGVAVHPSLSENVGGAVESLLSGVPTIASDVGGIPELVEDGTTGWLVPPRKPEVLAEVILRVLDDLPKARAVAREGRRRAQELFDVRRTGREIAQIYDTCLRSAGG